MKRKRNREPVRLVNGVKKLKRACDTASRSRGSMSTGSTVEVDYFALLDLIDYFEETRDAADRVVIARDALHQVFFSWNAD